MDGRHGLKIAYRGLSGMRKVPPASMEPMTHWMKRGRRQDRFELMKEQR